MMNIISFLMPLTVASLCLSTEGFLVADRPKEESITKKGIAIQQIRIAPLKKIKKFHVSFGIHMVDSKTERQTINTIISALERIGNVVVIDEDTCEKDAPILLGCSTVLGFYIDQLPERKCNSSYDLKLLPVMKVEMLVNSSVRVLETETRGVSTLWHDERYFLKEDDQKRLFEKTREYVGCLIDQFKNDYNSVNPHTKPTFIVFHSK